MPSAARIDFGERNEALALFARFASEPVALPRPSTSFGEDARLTSVTDASGMRQPAIATRAGLVAILAAQVPNARRISGAERNELDDLLPELAESIRRGAGGIDDPLIVDHLATQMTGGRDVPRAVSAPAVETVIARLPINVDRYLMPAIAAYKRSHSDTVRSALDELRDGTALVVRIAPEDRSAVGPDFTVTQLQGDDSLFIVPRGVDARQVFDTERGSTQSGVLCVDARSEIRSDHARLSVDESARLLTSLDGSRNVSGWRDALAGRENPDRSREHTASRPQPEFQR